MQTDRNPTRYQEQKLRSLEQDRILLLEKDIEQPNEASQDIILKEGVEKETELGKDSVSTSGADINQSKETTEFGADISQSKQETESGPHISQSEEATEAGADISQSEEETESGADISQSEEETESGADISQSEEEPMADADKSQFEKETESDIDTSQTEKETELGDNINQSEEETELYADISQSEEETESGADIRQSEEFESGVNISQFKEETESSAGISQSEEETESGGNSISKTGVHKGQSEEESKPSIDRKLTSQNQTTGHSVLHDSTSLKRILFYNPHGYYTNKGATKPFSFQHCEVTNCILSFNKREYSISDAVLLQWRRTNIESFPKEKRPDGQIWIYIQTEPPPSKNPIAERVQKYPLFYLGMRNSFNWTLTYSRNADIYLPYGILKLKPNAATLNRDYVKIAQSKTKDALFIVSHCRTPSRREEYAEILKQYISVDILGKCGQKWDCNHRYPLANDSCFDILNNTYRYYLAFENKLCREYISDRFFETFDYDILEVVRGADLSYRPIDIDPKAYISASDFQNVHALGKYLQVLSKNVTEYANLLEHKDKYTNFPFLPLFKQSMCDVCKRLNNLEKYQFVYEDLYEWFRDKEPCFKPDDL